MDVHRGPNGINSYPPDKIATTVADDIFRSIFVNESFIFILIEISLKIIPKGPMNNNPVLV